MLFPIISLGNGIAGGHNGNNVSKKRTFQRLFGMFNRWCECIATLVWESILCWINVKVQSQDQWRRVERGTRMRRKASLTLLWTRIAGQEWLGSVPLWYTYWVCKGDPSYVRDSFSGEKMTSHSWRSWLYPVSQSPFRSCAWYPKTCLGST